MSAFIVVRCPNCGIPFPVNCEGSTPIKYRIVRCSACEKHFNAWDNAQERRD